MSNTKDIAFPRSRIDLHQVLMPRNQNVRLPGDSVEKSFLGDGRKFLRAADALWARRREGPYRFIQNGSRTSVVALKSDAAAEKSKDRLSRDFWGCSIFDFCNNICHKRSFLSRSLKEP